jgi:hypothetical protein
LDFAIIIIIASIFYYFDVEKIIFLIVVEIFCFFLSNFKIIEKSKKYSKNLKFMVNLLYNNVKGLLMAWLGFVNTILGLPYIGH